MPSQSVVWNCKTYVSAKMDRPEPEWEEFRRMSVTVQFFGIAEQGRSEFVVDNRKTVPFGIVGTKMMTPMRMILMMLNRIVTCLYRHAK